MRATIRGLHLELPRPRCHRVVSAGRVTLHVTSDDPTRSVAIELTHADLADIESDMGMAGATITVGDLAASEQPTDVVPVPAPREIDDTPGAIFAPELGEAGA